MGWYEDHYGMSMEQFDAETLAIVDEDYGPCPPRSEWAPLVALATESVPEDFIDWRDY